MAFGKHILANPKLMSGDVLRDLLTEFGVISFSGFRLEQTDLNRIMSSIGELQNWEEQQAPISHTDRNNHALINLTNTDFLGATRMAWHTDQTYLETSYLPIRCLYSPVEPTNGNITSFADINYITDLLLSRYPEIENAKAKYHISKPSEDSNFIIRPIFSYCKHTGKKMLRFDTRMELLDADVNKFSEIVKEGLINAPKYNVEWHRWSFVIFDNNRCPHRRSQINGECHLQRLTSSFWLKG